MRLRKFNYLAPKTISEVCSFLKEYEGHAKVMAGGTDLLVSMKQRVKTPEQVISLKGIPDLSYIKQNEKEMKIGAMTLISDLERSIDVREHFPILAQAARCLASPNLRNLGTLGGNICLDTRCCYYNKSDAFRKPMGPCLKFNGDVCHVVKKGKKCLAIFQADMVPALIALAATLKVESSDGEKTIPIEDFYRDDGKDYLKLKVGEIVSEIQIPNSGVGTGGSYQKLRTRKSGDFALVAASVNLKLRNGLCEDVRIVLGSVGTCPIRVGKAEDMLRGKKMTDDVIEEAAEFAYKDAKPVANIVNVPPSYRKEMARIMMIQAAKEALSRVR